MKAIWGISLGALAAAAMVGGVVMAQEKATGVVAYRQSVMKANGAHMGALQVALTDQKQLLGNAEYHAEAIKEADGPGPFYSMREVQDYLRSLDAP